jgi:hypothetical protein
MIKPLTYTPCDTYSYSCSPTYAHCDIGCGAGFFSGQGARVARYMIIGAVGRGFSCLLARDTSVLSVVIEIAEWF